MKHNILSASPFGLKKKTVGSAHPAARTSDLPEDADPDAMANIRLAIIVRADELKDAGELVSHAALTVLGQFKKLYKRRDPSLKLWEGGGQRIEVRIASSESVLVAAQEAARATGIPTHTFAGIINGAAGKGKERSLMVIGPAEKSRVHNIIGRLEQA
jgi:peptidyl-tRNA hydrolase